MRRPSWQLAQYLRRIGSKDNDPPQLRQDVQLVQLVSDAHELAPALHGPRGVAGTDLTPQVGGFATVEIFAGSAGCWARVRLQTITAAAFSWKTFADVTGVPALVAGLTGTLRPTVWPQDFDQPLKTTVLCGSAAAAMAGGVDRPHEWLRNEAAITNGTTTLGDALPTFWLAPNVVLVMQCGSATLQNYVNVTLREPTDAPSPA